MPILLDLRNYKIFCSCTIQTFSCLDFEPQISLVAFTSCDINSTTVVLTYDRLATKQILYDIYFYEVINTAQEQFTNVLNKTLFGPMDSEPNYRKDEILLTGSPSVTLVIMNLMMKMSI